MVGFMRGILCFCLIVPVFFFSPGCSGEMASQLEYAPERENENPWVILLYDPSDFKKELVDKVAGNLKDTGVYVQSDDLRRFANYPSYKYDLIVMFANVRAWQVNGAVDDYLNLNKNPKNLFLVITSGQGDLTGMDDETAQVPVDVITAASKKSELETLTLTVTQKILLYIQQRK